MAELYQRNTHCSHYTFCRLFLCCCCFSGVVVGGGDGGGAGGGGFFRFIYYSVKE